MAADPPQVETGGRSTVSWSAENASTCTASGGWSGTRPASGTFETPPLSADTEFVLSCTGKRGGVMARTLVTIGSGDGTPRVVLKSVKGSVPENGSTTLEWSASGANSCTASGGWAGSKSTTGSEVVQGIRADTSFTLTCAGTEGAGIAMTEVQIRRATVRWVAPEDLEDAPHVDGFRLLWGKNAETPEHVIEIADAAARHRVIDLPGAGTFYFQISMLDLASNELARSNQVSKTLLP